MITYISTQNAGSMTSILTCVTTAPSRGTWHDKPNPVERYVYYEIVRLTNAHQSSHSFSVAALGLSRAAT